MPKDIKTEFAKRLKEFRTKYGYTQQRLSEIARVDYKHIQRLESKKPPAVRIDTLKKIAQAFGVNLSKLLDFDK